MADLNHCTVEHLAEVFGQHQDEVIQEWQLQAGELLQKLHLTKLVLTDHLPIIIAEITQGLAQAVERGFHYLAFRVLGAGTARV